MRSVITTHWLFLDENGQITQQQLIATKDSIVVYQDSAIRIYKVKLGDLPAPKEEFLRPVYRAMNRA